MRNYEDRAKDFIAQIFPLIENCEDVWEYREAVDTFNMKYSRKVKCGNGLARIALITSDYVVKIEYDSYEVGSIGGGENEVAMYEIAEREGFANLFARVTRYVYKDRRFYIMPRIYGIGKFECRYADEFMTQEERDFCDEHEITDLHENNYGFRHGHVCLVDYACRMWHDE